MAQLFHLAGRDIARTALGNQRQRHVVAFKALHHRRSQHRQLAVVFAVRRWGNQAALGIFRNQLGLNQRFSIGADPVFQLIILPF